MIEWWWIDTRWACGGIKTKDGVVIYGAPIFKKFKGQSIQRLCRSYKVEKLRGL